MNVRGILNAVWFLIDQCGREWYILASKRHFTRVCW